MTPPDPTTSSDGPDPALPEVLSPPPQDATAEPAEPIPPRPGTQTFTIEGRSAPGLFVVGWLATIVGLGCLGIAILSAGAAAIVLAFVGLAVLSVGLIAGAGGQAIERRARGLLPYVGPSPPLVMAAAIAISLLAGAIVGLPLALVDQALVEGPVGQLVGVSATALVYVAVIRLLVVDAGALTWREMGIRMPTSGTVAELAYGAMWAIPVIVATIPVALVLQQVFTQTPTSPLPPTGNDVGFVLQLVTAAVLAPLGEEIMFRGFATTAWARGIGARAAIVRGALFFAFIHVLGVTGSTAGDALALAFIAFAVRIPVALALGWLFLRRGSIWPAVGLHGAFNAILLVLGELALRSGAA